MNLADPELELIDPTPNVHSLFLQFDKIFFWTKLASRAVVRWSKRMYSCAGICSYEGRGGLCDIALSEPLLKLRPRKDLIETLLHEMIHAFLFVTNRDQNRDGHGPNFKAHMHRINNSAGLNISIYHSFHDEVRLYQTHVWRCNGPCQSLKPYFGIVRRAANRAPGPTDTWWKCHLRRCGGTFIKTSGPEKKQAEPKGKKAPPKNNADITKYISNKGSNIATIHKPVLKDSNSIPAKQNALNKPNSSVIMTQKDLNGSPKLVQPTISFSGKGQVLGSNRKRSSSVDVTETVRNIWANKQVNSTGNTNNQNKQLVKSNSVVVNNISNPNKHKSNAILPNTPPAKIKKIDDYLINASRILKDIYDQDFNVTINNNNNKRLSVVAVKKELLDCPICNTKVNADEINRHIDECLNKDIIEQLTQDGAAVVAAPNVNTEITAPSNLRNMIGDIAPIPKFKGRTEVKESGEIPVNTVQTFNTLYVKTENIRNIKMDSNSALSFDDNDVNTVRAIVDQINAEKRRESESGAPIERKPNIDFVPSNNAVLAVPVKVEPGTSKESNTESTTKECACCGDKIEKPLEEHLDECLAFFTNNTTVPEEGASTSFENETIVIDDDNDDFDETLTLNPTGTKYPCPCCMKMIEEAEMNGHLDSCMNAENNKSPIFKAFTSDF